jgi:hypothetical protein
VLDIMRCGNSAIGLHGGLFSGSQLSWPTVELERYAIKRGIERLWHMITENTAGPSRIFTDNMIFRYIFHPESDYV